jgi:hypothetical protein
MVLNVQSYIDVIVGGLLAQHGGVEGGRLARLWLQTTHGWNRTTFVDDRATPRCMFPLIDKKRGTRGSLRPELTDALQQQIDELLGTTAVPHDLLGEVNLIHLRGPDVTGGWVCESDNHTCPH